MSAALFEQAGEGRHQALSAGTMPADQVHPEVVDVMRELGVDLSERVPRRLSHELADQADVVVTMGCGDECPYIPGKRYIDWDLQTRAAAPSTKCAPPATTSPTGCRAWSPNSGLRASNRGVRSTSADKDVISRSFAMPEEGLEPPTRGL
jgi:Low molecular weight phosphotyrosine protein phosphatase